MAGAQITNNTRALTHEGIKRVVVYDVIATQLRLATRTLVPSVDALFYTLVAETVAARRDGGLVHSRHAYGTLEVVVNGCNLEYGPGRLLESHTHTHTHFI